MVDNLHHLPYIFFPSLLQRHMSQLSKGQYILYLSLLNIIIMVKSKCILH